MIGKLLLLGILSLVAANIAAQTVHSDPPFEPAFPDTRALGGAVIASAEGFESLYTNPAGFARGKPSFTLLTVASGLSPIPTPTGLGLLYESWSAPETTARSFAPSLGSSGFGGVVAAGIGYSGSGLGLGLILSGETWGISSLSSQATVTFVGGMAFKLKKHFSLGGAVRPVIRVVVPSIQPGELFSFLKSPSSSGVGIPSRYGFGVALDIGGIATYGPMSYGLAVSDIGGTRMYYAEDSLDALASSLLHGGGLPGGQRIPDIYTIPMQATVGIAYHPDLGGLASFFDPKIEIDWVYRFEPSNLLRVPPSGDLLGGIRAGADVRLLSFFHLRGGYEYGRLSAGAGMRLPGFQFDAEVFERVTRSNSPGPSRGMSAGVTIRF